MFQISFAIDYVRDAKKRQIYCHAAHHIAHGEIGSFINCRTERRGKVRQRRHAPQQQDPEQRLAQPGAIGQIIRQPGKPAAGRHNGQGGDAKDENAKVERRQYWGLLNRPGHSLQGFTAKTYKPEADDLLP